MYARRFGDDLEFRRRMWHVLCSRFFQRYVPRDASVVDLGAGFCEFINHIEAARKIAVDVRSDTADYAAPGVEVLPDLRAVASQSVGVVFASHFLEHLTREEIVRTVREVRRVLREDGVFLVLQPNIRYCYRDYWMFFDHITPLDDRSLTEVLENNGLRVTKMIPRFLPYTTKSRLPRSLLLIHIYLRVPLLWRLFGGAAFAVARPDSHV